MDITDEEAVKGLIRHIAEKYGKLDYLVNNASRVITTQHRMHKYNMDMVRKMVAVNVCRTFLCMKYAIERMLIQPGKGVIVNVSSASTEYAASRLSIYSATKSAINNLTQAGALE